MDTNKQVKHLKYAIFTAFIVIVFLVGQIVLMASDITQIKSDIKQIDNKLIPLCTKDKECRDHII